MEWNKDGTHLRLDDTDAEALNIVINRGELDHLVRGMCAGDHLIVSPEFVQDWMTYQKLMDSDRAGPFTDEELEDWVEILDILNAVDFDEVKTKYRFHRAPGYEYYPYEGSDACSEDWDRLRNQNRVD